MEPGSVFSKSNTRTSLGRGLWLWRLGVAEVKLDSEEKASLAVLGPEKFSWEGKPVTRPQLKELNTDDFGWVDLTASGFGMTIGVSNCWQQYPKALEISGLGRINIELVPKASPVLWGKGC